MPTSPKVFISYSWSSPDHEQWVLDLSKELVSNAVDVILDKWELREGHDSIKFMEQITANAAIKKVLLICDKSYVEKAKDRISGVGTETQIISSEIYAKTEQDKFAAIIVERDENGKPFLPTYYKSRMYIDLSSSDKYTENFEKLLRWIFDKPADVRPPLGTPPPFMTDDVVHDTGTWVLARRIIDGVKSDKNYVKGTFDQYLTKFGENLERYRMSPGLNSHDELMKSITDFIPSKNEFVEVITVICQYTDVENYINRLHRFFESIFHYMVQPNNVTSFIETDYDNYIFLVHELFLTTVSILLHYDHLEESSTLLSRPYYITGLFIQGRHESFSYLIFRKPVKILSARNQFNDNRSSPRADLLKIRAENTGVKFIDIMQADFVCYLRSQLNEENWFPETLVYALHQYSAFEIFARGKSGKYLERLIVLLGAGDKFSLLNGIKSIEDSGKPPRWDYDSISPAILSGVENLSSKP